MSELTLLALRFGFLLVLWAFIFAIIYALRSDLFGQRVRRLPADLAPSGPSSPASPPRTQSSSTKTPARDVTIANLHNAKRLVITSGAKEGLEIELTAEPVTIGRSAESGLVIRDDYTSTHHARLYFWGDKWAIQDLDSTNGTFLDDVRVTVPTPVPLNTPVRIGTTSFELRG